MYKRVGVLLVAGLLMAGCGGGGGGDGDGPNPPPPPPPPPSADTTLPAVVSTNPPNTAVGASLLALRATFSEALDPTTVTVGSVVVTGPTGQINGNVTVDGTTVSFTPSVPLSFNTDYQATLTTAIRDRAGNRLVADYTWHFNTGQQLALGSSAHNTCARLVDGRVKCWGVNPSGQLGLGDAENRGDGPNEMGANLPAVDLGSGRTAVQIVGGGSHICVRLDNLQIKCWGANGYGQLGRSTQSNSVIGNQPGDMGDNLPVVDLGTGRFAVELVAGQDHTCARLDNGRVKCWGLSLALGLGDSGSRGDTPDEMGDHLPYLDFGVNRTVVSLYAGWAHNCARLDNDDVKCWGFNSNGQLGLGDKILRGNTPQTVPANLPALDVGAGRHVVKMALGGQSSCAVLDNGQIKCWGDNAWGALGLGDVTDRGDAPGEMGDNLPPVSLGAGRTVVDLIVGNNHKCALLDNGVLKCWGLEGSIGQLGYGSYYDSSGVGDAPDEMGDALIAVNVGSNLKALEVVAGFSHTCARLDDGRIKCWGQAASGQLGAGDNITRGDQIAEMGDSLPAVDLGQ
ncbi:MAG: Ig-like domain-containing protein [Gammaproteobacteria bacterium]|nr:Ig-like domain-containing protein [Gammaproteobacteria bacterium]